jgi:hypothetical protein
MTDIKSKGVEIMLSGFVDEWVVTVWGGLRKQKPALTKLPSTSTSDMLWTGKGTGIMKRFTHTN